jgi:hypothetical protein
MTKKNEQKRTRVHVSFSFISCARLIQYQFSFNTSKKHFNKLPLPDAQRLTRSHVNTISITTLVLTTSRFVPFLNPSLFCFKASEAISNSGSREHTHQSTTIIDAADGYLKFSAFVWIWILLYGGSEPTALSVSKAKALLK